MTMPNEIVTWLQSLPHISDLQAMTVKIGKQCYPAVRYRSTTQLDSSCRVYQEGKRESVKTMIYCVGKLPACYVRSQRVAFRLSRDARDWYIACYAPARKNRKQADIEPQFAEYHPFGASFTLAPWGLPEAIDKYEKPYDRRTVDVQEWTS